MTNRDPQAQEELVRVFLQNACTSLLEGAASLKELLVAAQGFIEKGQFESALNSLAEAGHKVTAGAKFWDSLSKAAGEIGLHEMAKDFQFLWVQAASLALEREVKRK